MLASEFGIFPWKPSPKAQSPLRAADVRQREGLLPRQVDLAAWARHPADPETGPHSCALTGH